LPGRLSNRRTWIKLRIGIAQSDAAKEGTTMRSREREGRFNRMYRYLRCPALSIGVTTAGFRSGQRQCTPTAVNFQC